MAYLSLYRKYRPQTFAQVMGQEHVVQTLQNALRLGHVANGYLFCGTRGVAKTTIARVLAKCLNCLGPNGDFTVPQPEPCGVCEPCISIQSGQDVDVIEMDAASNRSVNDIARLRESVRFGPMQSRYKVYIIDEAHQLTSDAKDAFLKTLEEPPANVVFILATTESQAIPITIASRCQQFDFHRGSIRQIADQCAKVLGEEGLSMPPDALAIVARAAEGSYRDALSMLDQVLAYKREGITATDVAGVLGTVESEAIDTVLDAIAASDGASLFAQADDIYLQGKDVRQFLRALASRLRDGLTVIYGATPSLANSEIERLKGIVAKLDKVKLVRMLEIVADAERRIRQTDQHRILLETTLLRLSLIDSEPKPTVVYAQVPTSTKPVVETPKPSAPKVLPPVESESEPIREPAKAPSYRAGTPADTSSPESTLRHLQTVWHQVLNHIQARSSSLHGWMEDSYPVALNGVMFDVAMKNKACVDMVNKPKPKEFVEGIIDEKIFRVSAGTYRINPVIAESNLPTPPKKSKSTAPAAQPPPQVQQQTFDEDESTSTLDAVIAEFGGRIVRESE